MSYDGYWNNNFGGFTPKNDAPTPQEDMDRFATLIPPMNMDSETASAPLDNVDSDVTSASLAEMDMEAAPKPQGDMDRHDAPAPQGDMGWEAMQEIIPVTDEPIEEDDSFTLDPFQVVRREFFSHLGEPSITFSNYKIGLNSACIKRLPQVDYIQFLVNRQTRKLAIRPCLESDLNSFQWCTNSGGKRKPRQVTGKIFFMKLFSMMGWNPEYRYKLLGKLIRANGEYLFIFDLNSTEMFQRIVKDGEKPRISRTPVFPAEWQDQFGVPFEEHRKSLQINIFDNYAVYGLKDKEADATASVSSPTSEEVSDKISEPEPAHVPEPMRDPGQSIPMLPSQTTQPGGMNPWQNQ